MYDVVSVQCTLSVCAAFMLYSVSGAEWRHWLPTCCSTSLRLSAEIRSRACLSPLLPSSSASSPLLLSACPLVYYLCGPAHSPTIPPVTVSSWYVFCLNVAECKSQNPNPSSSLYLPLPSASLSLCSYLWSDYEAYHGISESHGMY